MITKDVLIAIPPILWVALRSLITAIVLVVVALVLKRPHPRPFRSFIGPMTFLAIFGGILTQAFFMVGLRYTTSINCSVLNTLTPVLTLPFAFFVEKSRFGLKKGIGFFLSLVGVLILCKVEEFSFSGGTLYGDFVTFLSCLVYAAFLVFGKDFFRKYDKIWCSAWLFAISSIGLGIWSFPQWGSLAGLHLTPSLFASMAYSVVGASILAYFLVIWVLSHSSAFQVAIFSYLQPLIASALAWGFAGEQITLRTLISSLLIFVGVGFTLEKEAGRSQ